jgi:hypothetical protein
MLCNDTRSLEVWTEAYGFRKTMNVKKSGILLKGRSEHAPERTLQRRNGPAIDQCNVREYLFDGSYA